MKSAPGLRAALLVCARPLVTLPGSGEPPPTEMVLVPGGSFMTGADGVGEAD